MTKILVHTCCAPCTTYSFERLESQGFKPMAFFYNPNIHPHSEYEKRKDEQIRFCGQKNYPLIIRETPAEQWFEQVKELSNEPEGGVRCSVCFKIRLEETAKFAIENNFEYFTTVLTISPHKNSAVIFKIGKEISEKYKLTFVEENFKKLDGFKKSLKISEEYGLFRQTYCGCVYSQR